VASLFRALASPQTEERADLALGFQDWVNMFQFGGLPYTVQGGNAPTGAGEKIESSFQGYVTGAYKSNGVVFACMLARMLLFAEARFQFRRQSFGRPGDLFGTQELSILETPWSGATTGDLLSRMMQDADLAGNFYGVRRRPDLLQRLRPDWVTIITGSRTGSEIDTELVGYAYQPGGPASGEDVIALLPENVVHFAPIPDPIARFRGMSWLTPIVDEIMADQATTTHKRSFFEKGAQLGYVVTMDGEMSPQKFDEWVHRFRAGHEGALNAYKTLFLAGGADVKTVGTDFKQLDLKAVQGAGETRIAAAAGVPPVVVGLSEGLQAATYSNYAQARRRFADQTMRPLWRNAAGSLARIINVPPASELWYDDRDIPALREDEKDAADIQQSQAVTIRELINAGYEPDSVVKAVTAGDYNLLTHTGLVSVQLQEPGAQQPPSVNGNGQPQLPAPTP
jgi:HK97 family phage portal protein